MKSSYLLYQLVILALIIITIACTENGEIAEDGVAPEFIVPQSINPDGEPEKDGLNIYVNDYSNALHAIFMIAGNMRDSEYGHENYRPELYPDEMNAMAERWLDLMHATDQFFNEDGRFVNRYVQGDNGFQSSDELDLSIYPHLVYSYHMHHRGSRFDDHVLYERLSREPANFIVMPGRYLLDYHYQDGRFVHEQADVDHLSMSYGLAGIHGHGYAWIVWKKPEGEDNMGLLTEDMLESWLNFSIEDMLTTYREIADVLDEAWIEESNIYDFGDGNTWQLDAVGAMIRGKKTMYDSLYMFGDNSDKERAREIFERTADMVEAVLPLTESWGLPSSIEFTPDGAVAASAEVNLYDWYQFLNHLGGGFAFDREREGTSEFINRYRDTLNDQLTDLYDEAMRGMLQYHVSDDGTLANVVAYEDGAILDDRLMVSTMGMWITTAGNIYTNGDSFARADSWGSVSDEVAERSRQLYDLKFYHIELLENTVFGE